MSYLVRRARTTPELKGDWDGPAWRQADVLAVAHFRPESSWHRPVTEARLLYDDRSIHVLFRVQDRYVRSIHTDYLAPVCRDSCVEWFARPKPDKGYVNFELNCGGTLHCSYIEDPTRTADGFKRFSFVPASLAAQVQIYHSMPRVVTPEIEQPVAWVVQYSVPVLLFEHYVGPLGALAGCEWLANFYKCGDDTSHPHWAAWSPVQELNFHRPQDFAPIQFE
ncbi:MAG: carbohydrate-binding family 9-like protein [Chloroflexi bacterium]|nr:carbohydrate-binding family 9-like protein [Chloroflexota bacterium]